MGVLSRGYVCVDGGGGSHSLVGMGVLTRGVLSRGYGCIAIRRVLFEGLNVNLRC